MNIGAVRFQGQLTRPIKASAEQLEIPFSLNEEEVKQIPHLFSGKPMFKPGEELLLRVTQKRVPHPLLMSGMQFFADQWMMPLTLGLPLLGLGLVSSIERLKTQVETQFTVLKEFKKMHLPKGQKALTTETMMHPQMRALLDLLPKEANPYLPALKSAMPTKVKPPTVGRNSVHFHTTDVSSLQHRPFQPFDQIDPAQAKA